MGVRSLIDLTLKPFCTKNRITVSLPDPIPFILISISFTPSCWANEATSSAARVAAYGVPFFEPLNPRGAGRCLNPPFASSSVRAISVLLYDEEMCTKALCSFFFEDLARALAMRAWICSSTLSPLFLTMRFLPIYQFNQRAARAIYSIEHSTYFYPLCTQRGARSNPAPNP